MGNRTYRTDLLTVSISETHDEMALHAATTARAALQGALQAQGYASAILASAASQIKFLDILTALEGIQWNKVTLFHMDEYLGITPDHPASFRRFLRERVEQRVKPAAFHYIAGEAMEPLKELGRYSDLLRAQPVDLCILGIGENGHIAFNDPPVADFDDPQTIKLAKLDLKCRRQQVGEGAFPDLFSVPQYAYTLTIPTLCAAKEMICVVPERRKAEAVRDALNGPISTACPASVLRRMKHATLFLDSDSAALL